MFQMYYTYKNVLLTRRYPMLVGPPNVKKQIQCQRLNRPAFDYIGHICIDCSYITENQNDKSTDE
jgi:hypothetical protein